MSKFTIQYLLTTFFCDLKWETKVPTTSKSIPKLEQQTTCSNHHLSWLLPSLRFVLLSEGGILSVMMELLFGGPLPFFVYGTFNFKKSGASDNCFVENQKGHHKHPKLFQNITWPCCFCAFCEHDSRMFAITKWKGTLHWTRHLISHQKGILGDVSSSSKVLAGKGDMRMFLPERLAFVWNQQHTLKVFFGPEILNLYGVFP